MRLVLSQNYFTFQDIYQPEKGVSIWSPTSSTIAEIFYNTLKIYEGTSKSFHTFFL
jgi:hypothetical protein